MKLGEQLAKLREQKGISREDLAREMNVSRQAVYKWENDKGYPDIKNLIRLSEFYQVTLDELIKSDQVLQKKINISNKENDNFFNPGFYLGILLVFIGLFINMFFDSEVISVGVITLGFLTILFYESLKRIIKNEKRDFS